MIGTDDALPDLACFVPGGSARTLCAIDPDNHLVVYLARHRAPDDLLATATRWPLPTRPRATFITVDHESTGHGFIRVQPVWDTSLQISALLAPTDTLLRAIVVDRSRRVVAVSEAEHPDQVRSAVSLALHECALRAGTALHTVPRDATWADLFGVLAARTEMLLSPLVESVRHMGETAVPGLDAGPTISMEVVLIDDRLRGEAIERLVGSGYQYAGDLGRRGCDHLWGPDDEPRHTLLFVPPR